MGCLFSILLSLVLLVGGFGFYATYDLPPVEELMAQRQNTSAWEGTRIYASDESTVIFSNGRFRHKKIQLGQISPHVVDAIIATEDRRFYSHQGVDPLGIARATFTNLTNKEMQEGASTITQQLARNLFLSQERSLRRKFREMWLAWQLEQTYSKDAILEMYLNTIYFGEGAYGVQAAAEVYFSKPADKLSIPEAALIAGLPQAPSRLNPFVNPDLALKRRNEVIDNLVEAGKLSAGEAEGLKNQGLGLNPLPNRLSLGDQVPFFNRLVQQRVMNWYGLNEQEFWQAGFKIYTTIDLRAQRLAENAVASASRQYGRTGSQQEASLVCLRSSDGAVVAYVGGRNFKNNQYDKASMARRSPGSLFKVFTYAEALSQGYRPEDVLVDEPISFGNWKPENYNKSHAGAMTLAQAFAYSNNVIAVKLLYEIGPQSVVDLAQRMGVESPLKPYLALTLGGSSVTLLEMTGAVNAFNNQGLWVKPYVVTRIVDPAGNTIFRHESQVRDVVSPTVANTMVRLMQGVVQYGTGRQAQFAHPAAGKSGTSDLHRDAWFVGYTPDYTAGVWVGNNNNSPMDSAIAGGTLPASTWRQFMQAFVAALPPKDFELPNSTTLPPQLFDDAAPDPTAEGGIRIEPLDDMPAQGLEPTGEQQQGRNAPEGGDEPVWDNLSDWFRRRAPGNTSPAPSEPSPSPLRPAPAPPVSNRAPAPPPPAPLPAAPVPPTAPAADRRDSSPTTTTAAPVPVPVPAAAPPPSAEETF